VYDYLQMQFSAMQALAYLGGIAAIVAIFANGIKIYEFVSPRLAEYRKKTATTKKVSPPPRASYFHLKPRLLFFDNNLFV
jgi:hypothetical protein